MMIKLEQVFKTGEAAMISYQGRTQKGRIVIASGNSLSLVVQSDEGALSDAGGIWIGAIPVLWSNDEDGFVHLISGHKVGLAKIPAPTNG